MSYWDQRTNEARNPRRTEVKLLDGRPLGRPDTGWTDELLALCALVPVVTTTRPADTATTRYVRSVVAGTEVWTETAKTQAEMDAEAAQSDRDADRADLIAAAVTQILARMDAIDTKAATFAGQASAFAGRSDANNNAQALALVNDLKNVVVPALGVIIAAALQEIADAGRRDVKIVRLTVGTP